MILTTYAHYKDSGTEWLGEVPEHWEVKSVRHCFAVVGGTTPKSDNEAFWDGDILWATPADLDNGRSLFIDETKRTITQAGYSSCGLSLVPPGTIILSTRAPIGSLAISLVEMCTNQGCKSLLPKNGYDSSYYAYLLSVSGAELNIRGKGTTFLELSGDALAAFRLPAPDSHEQSTIAAFLHRETAKIDELVGEQRRLIELLKEKRQAVISHAVTKGLNPNAPMKPSNIPWLSDVPEHWDVAPFRLAVAFQEGPGIMAADFHDEGVPLLRVSGVQGTWATLKGCNYLDPELVEKRWSHFRVEEGDLLISASASMGTVTEVGPEAAGAVPYTGLIRLNGRQGVLINNYVKAFVVSDMFLTQIDLLKAGSTIQHFGPTHLSQMKIAFPPDEAEQIEVANFVDESLERYDKLMDTANEQIDLLGERRTALIFAAVTGKIDVRNAIPESVSV